MSDVQAVSDARHDARQSIPSVCGGDCQKTTVSADFSGIQLPFTRAVYGHELTSGGIYIEAYDGGDLGCPTASSPTPDRTIVISVMPPQLAAMSVSVTLFDFAKLVLKDKPLTKSTSGSARYLAADLGAAASPRFLALELEAVFPEGTLKGQLYATYCQSLDL